MTGFEAIQCSEAGQDDDPRDHFCEQELTDCTDHGS